MKLFIELYLDEDVSVLIATLLRSRGFRCITTRDAGMLGGSDEEQLVYAVKQKSVLLTHNKVDFEKLYNEYLNTDREHFGIIIARRDNEYSMLKRLLKILNYVTAEQMRSKLKYI